MSHEHFEEEEFATRFNGHLVWRMLRQGLPHWRLTLIFLVCISGMAVVGSYTTYLGKQIVDDAILRADLGLLDRLAREYGLLVLVEFFLVFGFISAAEILGGRVRYDLRKAMFERLQELSLSYFDRTPTGWIVSRVTSDVNRVGELVSWGFLDTAWGLSNIAAAMGFMLYINWRAALIVLAILPVLLVVAGRFQKVILTEFREVRKLNSRLTGTFSEGINGVRVVKALGQERRDLAEFDELASGLYRCSFRAAWLSALFLPVVQLLTAVGVGGVLWFTGTARQGGGMTIGGIQAFVSYITFMLWPIQEMARVYAELQHAVASGERIFSLIDAVPEIEDRPGASEPDCLRGPVSFEGVTFAYQEGRPILRDFSLSVGEGETVALVGPTGVGKSTLVNLLCRFYEPQEGTIRICGHHHQSLTQRAIQSRVGMVLQTPHLFRGSIAENIRYGRLEASEEEVQAAARLAGAHDFIAALEEGYGTDVGEGGTHLSVGQKQLVSLARAILSDPDILIMDEATSSVDTLTEAQIQRGMEVLMQGRTSFVIAHRLSTIRRADRIVVLAEGGIQELGHHSELIRQRGRYYELYTRQFREERTPSFDLLAEPVPAAAGK